MIKARRLPEPERRPWPVPGDTSTDRARQIARSLLAALRKLDPAEADRHVTFAVMFGETWLAPTPDLAAGERRLTDAEAATVAGRHPVTIRRWVSEGTSAGRLRRHPDGIDEAELLAFIAATRQAATRAAPTQKERTPA